MFNPSNTLNSPPSAQQSFHTTPILPQRSNSSGILPISNSPQLSPSPIALNILKLPQPKKTCNSSLYCTVLNMVYTITVNLYTNNHPDSIPRLKAKLVEAARIYRKDRETVDWFVMQDVHDPRAFTIVERFETEAVGSPVSSFGERIG
jgi:hypothetical protein